MGTGRRLALSVGLGLAVVAASCTSGEAPRSESSPSPNPSLSTVAEVATTTAAPRSVDCNSREKEGDEVQTTVRYRCYAVRGETGDELIRDLKRGAPARWSIRQTIQWSGFEGGSCSTDSVRVYVDLEYLFPHWAGPAERSVELLGAWKEFVVELEEDLARLRRASIRAGRAVHEALSDLSSPCAGFESAARKLARRVVERHRKRVEEESGSLDPSGLLEAA